MLRSDSCNSCRRLQSLYSHKQLSLIHICGEVFGFLGPNGAGKTTTIKMVMGFLFADSGEIIVNNYSLKKNYEKAMSYLGGIVENPEMYKELTGRTNLEMYARLHNVDKKRIDQVVEMVGMTARVNEKVKKYSLGMKQRIGLAQALLHSPKVLILDEPTNGLDPMGVKELRDILKHLAHDQGVAVVVSSHMLSEMELMCDRVGIIAKGKLIGVKNIKDLLSVSGKTPYKFTTKQTKEAKMVLEAKNLAEKIVKITDLYLELDITEAEVPQYTAMFAEKGIAIFGIEKKEISLEEAFINITGGGLDIG